LIVLGSVALSPTVSLCDDPSHPFCRLLLLEERNEREDLELAVDLAASDLAAAEQIYQLFEGLWKADAVERLLYLRGKHSRDVSKLDHERLLLLLERQDALIDQLRLACSETSSEKLSQDERSAYDRAHARYLKADCGRLTKETAIARVDLTYLQEVLHSVRDLRENDVATRQEVIVAERNVEQARKRLAQGGLRTARCPNELEAASAP
jgi:hypothetical protein